MVISVRALAGCETATAVIMWAYGFNMIGGGRECSGDRPGCVGGDGLLAEVVGPFFFRREPRLQARA